MVISPLHTAAYHGHLRIVSLLLESSADVNVVNIEGETPFDWAEEEANVEIKALLREHGGQITVESTPGSGSRFTVELPALVPKPAAAFDPTETTESGGTDSDE